MSHLHGSTENTSTDTASTGTASSGTASADEASTENGTGPNGSLHQARRSVLRDILTPVAKATLLSAATLAGTAALTAPQSARAQIGFESATDLFPGLQRGASSIGDFDGDGDLDLLVSGSYYGESSTVRVAKVYENGGSGNGDLTDFSEAATLDSLRDGSSSVGDFDGDGDLDLLLAGSTYSDYDSLTTGVYENGGDENGDLTDFTKSDSLANARDGSSSVGDFDGDGDLDLLVTGQDNSDYSYNYTAKIYENGGSGNGDLTDFSLAASLTGVISGSSSVGDFDGDGDLDLLVTGQDNSYNITAKIYENGGDENGDLTDFSEAASLTGVEEGSSSVGDFDGDGDLDLLITGSYFDGNSTVRVAKIYENGGNENGDLTDFSEAASLTGVIFGSSSAGDFDGDGDLDLLVTGQDNSYNITAKIYENGGSSNGDLTDFSAVSVGLVGVQLSSSSVGDFDGDLDLDLLVTGDDDGQGYTSKIYENTSDVPIPVELTSFTARQDGSGAILTWQTASETNNAGFEVHRMLGEGAGTFERIGFVEGGGTTAKPQTYRFRTDRLSPGTHRFRLKQIDTDGSATYSKIAEVKVGISGAYRLTPPSPNPSEGRAQIRLAVKESQPVQVTVYDVLGREVRTAFDRVLSGQSERAIRVGKDLPTGTYLIRVEGTQFTATERLTVVE